VTPQSLRHRVQPGRWVVLLCCEPSRIPNASGRSVPYPGHQLVQLSSLSPSIFPFITNPGSQSSLGQTPALNAALRLTQLVAKVNDANASQARARRLIALSHPRFSEAERSSERSNKLLKCGYCFLSCVLRSEKLHGIAAMRTPYSSHPIAQMLYICWLFEQPYNRRCMAKSSHYLAFISSLL